MGQDSHENPTLVTRASNQARPPALSTHPDYLRIHDWITRHSKEIARSDLNRRYLAALPSRDTDLKSRATCLTVEAYYAQEAAGWSVRVSLPGLRRSSLLERNLILAYLAGRWCPPDIEPVAEPWDASQLATLAKEKGGFDWLPVAEPTKARVALSRVKTAGYLVPTPEQLRNTI